MSTTSEAPSRWEPSIQELQDFVMLWVVTKRFNCHSITEARNKVKKELDRFIKNATPLVRKMEALFRHEFFQKKPHFAVMDPEDPVIDNLETIISNYLRLIPNIPKQARLRLGVGHSLSLSLAPAIIAQFRQEFPGVAIEVVVDYSERLRDRLLNHQLDFVITCISQQLLKEKDYEFVARYQVEQKTLSIALISPWSHPVADKFRRLGRPEKLGPLFEAPSSPNTGKTLEQIAVHVFEGPFKPAIFNPKEFVRDLPVRCIPQTSYAIINSLVSSGNDLGITIPELLTPEQARRVQVIPFPNSEKSGVALTLLSIAKQNPKYIEVYGPTHNGGFRAAFDRLQEIATERIVQTASKEGSPVLIQAFLELPSKYGRVWMRGIFSQSKSDESSFVGNFHVDKVWNPKRKAWVAAGEKQRRFVIDGTKERQVGGDGGVVEHIIARGYDQQDSAREEFCVNFVQHRDSSEAGCRYPVVGMWQGREVGNTKLGESLLIPSAGYFLMASEDSSPVDYDQEKLAAAVKSWHRTAQLPAFSTSPDS